MKKFLIIPGLPRCATTSFAQVIGQHPDVFLPLIKEPHFFLPQKDNYYMFDRRGKKIPFNKSGFIYTTEAFEANYKNFKSNKVFIDGSTLYVAHTQAIDEIYKQQDIEPFFIILKREPFKRAISHYLYSVSRGEEFRKFDDALQDEKKGLHKQWLLKGYMAGSNSFTCEEKIKAYWGEDHLLTADIDNEDVFSNDFMKKVLNFLDLNTFRFDFSEQANSLSYSDNKFLNEVRILMKRVRQINPLLLDNKLTRKAFNGFMKKMPLKNNVYAEYEMYRDLYNELFYSKAYDE